MWVEARPALVVEALADADRRKRARRAEDRDRAMLARCVAELEPIFDAVGAAHPPTTVVITCPSRASVIFQ